MDGLDWTGLDPLRSLVPLEHLAVLKICFEESVFEKKIMFQDLVDPLPIPQICAYLDLQIVQNFVHCKD